MNEPTPRTDALAEKLTPLAATLTIATAETVIRQILTELLLHSHTLERELAQYQKADSLNRINMELGRKELTRVKQELAQAVAERDAALVPLCIGSPIIGHLARDGQWISEDGRGVIAADDLFHHDPFAERDAALAQVHALQGALERIEGGHYKTTNLTTPRLLSAAHSPTALAELRDEMITELQSIARAALAATK